MSLFTAEGMLRGWVRFCVSGIGPAFAAVTAGAYCRWLKTQGYRKRLDIPRQAGWLITHKELFSRRAPGTTCISALRSLKEGDVRAENDSKGCGGVMRVAPVGIFMSRAAERCGQSIESTFQLGADIAAIT